MENLAIPFMDVEYESSEESEGSSFEIEESSNSKINENGSGTKEDRRFGIRNPFSYNKEMEGITAEIIEQSVSKTEWLIVEHLQYQINVKLKDEASQIEVFRKYRDFEWLTKEIDYKYPGIILHPIPEKNAFSKINLQSLDLISREEFLQVRLFGLREFLSKLLQHPKLSFTSEVRSFLLESEEEFEATKEKAIEQRKQKDEDQITKFFSNLHSSISNAVDYVSGTKARKIRDRNKEDELFENYEKYYEDQRRKLSDTVECLKRIFNFKKSQADNMKNISSILLALNKDDFQIKGIQQLQGASKDAGEIEITNSIELKFQVELPLMEQVRHLDGCLSVLKHRTELLNRMFEGKLKIEALQRQSRNQEQEEQIWDDIDKDKKRLNLMEKIFIEDSEYFNNLIESKVKNILLAFSQMQILHSTQLSQIWMPN